MSGGSRHVSLPCSHAWGSKKEADLWIYRWGWCSVLPQRERGLKMQVCNAKIRWLCLGMWWSHRPWRCS